MDNINGMDYRIMRVRERIPIAVIAEMIGMSSSSLTRRELGMYPFSSAEARLFKEAVERCKSGKHPYTPTQKRVFSVARRGTDEEFASFPRICKLREQMLALDMPQRALAAALDVSIHAVSCVITGRCVKKNLYEKMKAGIEKLLAEKEMPLAPAKDTDTPEDVPAKNDDTRTDSLPDSPEDVPAKNEHIHYTSCKDADVVGLSFMLAKLEIPRPQIANFLGMPLQLLNAKLDSVMPMYQPEFDTIIKYIKNMHARSSISLQKHILFPEE